MLRSHRHSSFAFNRRNSRKCGWVRQAVSSLLIPVSSLFACLGCAPIQAWETSAPFEKAQIAHRVRLADHDMVRISARREGLRVAVQIEDLTFCRDDLLVSRGIEVRTHRSLNAEARSIQWLAFGAWTGLAVLGAAVFYESDCSPDAPTCLAKAAGVSLALVAATGAVVSGTVLLVDELRASDTSKTIETSRTSERVVRVCRSQPRQGVVVQALFDSTRAQAVTNDDGRVVLDMSLPSSPVVAVRLSLDGIPIGIVPLSLEWRRAVLRREPGSR